MATSYDTPDRRDRNVKISRRMRAGMISAAVLGSLGFAGYAASSTTHSPSVVAASSSPQVIRWVHGDDGEDYSTVQSSTSGAAPSLQPGLGGSSHATTSGSQVAVSPSGQVGKAASNNGPVVLSPGSGTSHSSTHGS